MNVLVLYGGTGGDGCHVEVFQDTERGEKKAKARKSELVCMNPGWKLKLERHSPK